MKISELPRLDNIRGDAEIPVAVEGENFNVTMGQILDDAAPDMTISYEDMVNMTLAQAIQYAYSQKTSRLAVTKQTGFAELANVGTLDLISDDSAHVVTQIFTTHFTSPQPDGTFAMHTDTELYTYIRYIGFRSTSLPKEWSAWKMRGKSEPIEVASVEEMEQRIAAGEYEEGQIYFLAES